MRRNKTSATTAGSGDSSDREKAGKKGKNRKIRKRKQDFNFDAEGNRDVLGIVAMEIKSASDLPKLKSCESPRQYRMYHS
jgi:phosphatidylserine decarboxylase